MRVLITGVASSLGPLLAGRLLADPAVDGVTGLDTRACHPPIEGLRFVRARLDQPDWLPLLDGIDRVVHLAALLDWPARRELRTLPPLDAHKRLLGVVVGAGVPRVVAVSSALLYGAQGRAPLAETASVRGHTAGPYARQQAMLADYLDALAAQNPQTRLIRLRVGWISGPYHRGLAHYLATVTGLPRGAEKRPIQIVHEDDLIGAIRLAMEYDLADVTHVAGDANLTLQAAAALAGARDRVLPLLWLRARAAWGWRWLGHRTPPEWVMALARSPVLLTDRLHGAGWVPRYTSRRALATALDPVQGGVQGQRLYGLEQEKQ